MKQQAPVKLWTWQYIIIIIMTFLFFLSLQALMGGFPAFVGEITHDPAKGGLMTTSFMLAAIFTRPFIGIFMHKLNMKATLIVTLLFVLITIGLSFGRATFSILVMLRILQGISFGIISTLFATFATNLIPSARIGEGIGYFGMATSLGTTFGPMIALSMLHSYSFNKLLTVMLFITLLTAAGSFFIKNNQGAPAAKPVPDKSLFEFAFDKRAFLPCLLVALFYITFSGIVNFIDGLGAANHFGGKVSIFFLIVAGMMVFTRPFSGKIYDRFGHKLLIYPASVSGIIGLILLAFTHNFAMLSAAAVFYGIAYGIMQPTFQAWAVSRVTPEKKGTANAMSLSFMDLGMAIGAGTLGNVAVEIGYNATYGLSSFLIFLLVFLYMAFSLTNKTKKEQLKQSA
ncbi:Predicted arabinose efflux permease, MFS family [Bacillus sp. OV322]|uniref:MFS transporter n=1 Tax=Bacillus sp. OV322 TaxID=1882764 RepID=UPI0008E3A398|nr:MFS transporter [Bacillus sp. OV322]SFC64208.1 Predicted arabinose efflux permease, MFS family [Bacillus sp. OV322]